MLSSALAPAVYPVKRGARLAVPRSTVVAELLLISPRCSTFHTSYRSAHGLSTAYTSPLRLKYANNLLASPLRGQAVCTGLTATCQGRPKIGAPSHAYAYQLGTAVLGIGFLVGIGYLVELGIGFLVELFSDLLHL